MSITFERDGETWRLKTTSALGFRSINEMRDATEDDIRAAGYVPEDEHEWAAMREDRDQFQHRAECAERRFWSELDGNAELRRKFGARDDEGFPEFVERLARERDEAQGHADEAEEALAERTRERDDALDLRLRALQERAAMREAATREKSRAENAEKQAAEDEAALFHLRDLIEDHLGYADDAGEENGDYDGAVVAAGKRIVELAGEVARLEAELSVVRDGYAQAAKEYEKDRDALRRRVAAVREWCKPMGTNDTPTLAEMRHLDAILRETDPQPVPESAAATRARLGWPPDGSDETLRENLEAVAEVESPKPAGLVVTERERGILEEMPPSWPVVVSRIILRNAGNEGGES